MTHISNIDKRAMTPLLKNVLTILERLPEERLAFVLSFLRK